MRRDIGWYHDCNIAHGFSLSAALTQETDGQHFFGLCYLERLNDIGRIASCGYGYEDVTLTPQAFELARKDKIKCSVIGPSGQHRAVSGESSSGEGSSHGLVFTQEFGREVLRVRSAATIAGNVDALAGEEGFLEENACLLGVFDEGGVLICGCFDRYRFLQIFLYHNATIVLRMADFLQKLKFLAYTYLHALKRGTAKGSLKDPQNVIIIQPAQLGDMVCTTPMFRAIKKQYPHCKVTVAGKPVGKLVLEGNKDVDEYIVWSEDLSAMAALFRERKFDFGCMTSPSFHALAALFFGNVRVIAAPTVTNGWTPYEIKPYKLLRFLVNIKTHRMRSYAPGEYLKLLEPINIHTHETKKFVYYTKAAGERADEILKGIPQSKGLLVGIVTGAGNKIKQWPPERFAEVADYLIEKHNARVVIIGGRDNINETKAMLGALRHADAVLDTTAALTLEELKALVDRLDMMISVDTGPVFFAEAQGIPTIDIAGNIDENEQAPNDGKMHLVVVPKDRKGPVVMTMNAHVIDFDEALRQINAISAEMVIEVAETLIGRIKVHA